MSKYSPEEIFAMDPSRRTMAFKENEIARHREQIKYWLERIREEKANLQKYTFNLRTWQLPDYYQVPARYVNDPSKALQTKDYNLDAVKLNVARWERLIAACNNSLIRDKGYLQEHLAKKSAAILALRELKKKIS